jgi:hypothetical protein
MATTPNRGEKNGIASSGHCESYRKKRTFKKTKEE